MFATEAVYDYVHNGLLSVSKRSLP